MAPSPRRQRHVAFIGVQEHKESHWHDNTLRDNQPTTTKEFAKARNSQTHNYDLYLPHCRVRELQVQFWEGNAIAWASSCLGVPSPWCRAPFPQKGHGIFPQGTDNFFMSCPTCSQKKIGECTLKMYKIMFFNTWYHTINHNTKAYNFLYVFH